MSPVEIPPVVTHLVNALSCISVWDRALSEIRFYGTQKHLAAYCTDGHLLARVVVKADFSNFGQQAVSAHDAATLNDWKKTRKSAIASALGFAVESPPMRLCSIADAPSRANFDRQFEVVGKGVAGFWGGEPLRKAFEVVERLSTSVQIRGNESPTSPIVLSRRELQLDVSPRAFFADLDIVVMPRREA